MIILFNEEAEDEPAADDQTVSSDDQAGSSDDLVPSDDQVSSDSQVMILFIFKLYSIYLFYLLNLFWNLIQFLFNFWRPGLLRFTGDDSIYFQTNIFQLYLFFLSKKKIKIIFAATYWRCNVTKLSLV